VDEKKDVIDARFIVTKIHNEIGVLSSYLKFGHETFQKLYQSIDNELDENILKIRQLENIPDEVSNKEILLEERGIEFVYDMSFYASREHEKIFYATIVIMLYSCIERGLKELCGMQREAVTNLLFQAREILDYKLNCKINAAIWKELKCIRDIRNIIVHSGLSLQIIDINDSGGLLIDEKPEIIEYLKSKHIYEEPYISIHLNYCKYVIDFANKFFLEIRTLYRNKKDDEGKGSHNQLPVWLLETLKKTPKDDENQNDNN